MGQAFCANSDIVYTKTKMLAVEEEIATNIRFHGKKSSFSKDEVHKNKMELKWPQLKS